MAEKIEMFAGWDWDGSAIVGRERNIHINKECTVVVHDGKAERVFAESEVRAIMQKMNDGFEAEMRTSVQFPGRLEVDESVVHDRIDEACDAFGIVLDPA